MKYTILLTLMILLFLSCRNDDEMEINNPEPPDFVCTNVIDLGVDNSGLQDCSSILQEAINEGKNLCFPSGIYRIDKTLLLSNDSSKYIFENSILTSPNKITLLKISGKNISIDGLTIDMNNSPVDNSAISIRKPSENIQVQNTIVRNIKGVTGDRYQHGLYIELDGVESFLIDNCAFQNIQLENDGDETILDFANGIYLSTSEYISPSTGIISNCKIENIFNTPYNSDSRIDADGIRFWSGDDNLPQESSEPRICIKDCQFINNQKRAIKLSGISDILIQHAVITNNREDSYQFEGVGILGNSKRIVLDRINITGNIIRGIWVLNAKQVEIRNLIFTRIPTIVHSILASWAIRIDSEIPSCDICEVEDIVVENLIVNNSKAVLINKSKGIELTDIDVQRIEVNPLDNDGDGNQNTTYFDKIFEFTNSSNIVLNNGRTQTNSSNIPTALKILDCQNVEIIDSWLRGWGNSIVEVFESNNNTCENITFLNGGVEQLGYISSWNDDFRSVSFLSNNNNGVEEGISNTSIKNWKIIIPQIPSSLSEYDFIVLFETPNSMVDSLAIEYSGSQNSSLSSMIFITHADNSIFKNLLFESNVMTRSGYLIESSNIQLDSLVICIPESYLSVDNSCENISIDYLNVQNDFQQNIENIINNPTFNIIQCN